MTDRICQYKLPCPGKMTITYSEGGEMTHWGQLIQDIPPHTAVQLELSPEPDSFIRCELWLPDTFDGTFVSTGNGGMAGNINYRPLTDYIKMGLPVMNTDMGTSRGMASGIGVEAVWNDFGSRATHLATAISKEIVELAYGEKIRHSYFVGGSTGGQQALAAAQRYPLDYDGIIAGAPANNRICLHTFFLWVFRHAKNPDRTPMFDRGACEKLRDCAVDFYAARETRAPGENYIHMPKNDPYTVAAFIDHLRVHMPQLTDAQLSNLSKIYLGPTNPRTGERIYNGYPMGSEVAGGGLAEISAGGAAPHDYPFFWGIGKDFDYYDFDFDRDLDRLLELESKYMDANDPDLTPFFSHGGKLICISATGDCIVPSPDAVNYYRRVRETCASVDESMVFYLAPYIDHGIAGVSPTVVSCDDKGEHLFYALRRWCEKGEKPTILRLHLPEAVSAARIIPLPPITDEQMASSPAPCCDRYLRGGK